MDAKRKYGFFLLRYVPDAVKDEFVNIGVVLIGEESDYADVQLTRDWRRVYCLDPSADIELLDGLEREIRMQLSQGMDRATLLSRLQDSFSNLIQLSEMKGCIGGEPAEEMDNLATMYLQSMGRGAKREVSERRRIVTAMRAAFEQAGVWKLMRQEIRASDYTYLGDPLKIDCGYRPNGIVKMFHGVPLKGNVEAVKALAFSYPQIVAGIRKKEDADCKLIAVVEASLDGQDAGVQFAVDILNEGGIGVSSVDEMPQYAELARKELGVRR
jgi:hypothetical protein